MERFIFEKREAINNEKTYKTIYDMDRKGIIQPRYMGEKEAIKRLPGEPGKIKYLPCVYVTKKSGYIPVRYKNNEKYLIA